MQSEDGIRKMLHIRLTRESIAGRLFHSLWIMAFLFLPIMLSDGQAPPGAPPNVGAPGAPGTAGPGAEGAGTAGADTASGTGGGLDTKLTGPILATQTDLSQMLTLIGADAGVHFTLDQGINPKVTFSLESPTIREVLDTVLPGQGLAYLVTEGGNIRIGNEAVINALKQGELELITQTFRPNYVNIDSLKETLGGIRTDAGQLIFENDSNRIIVKDTPEAVAEMEKIIAELDIQTETRVFEIEHADVQAVADQLEGVINTQEGELIVDERNSMLIITDTIDRLDQAEAIIEQLDKDLEIRVFPLKFTDEYNIDFIIGLLEPMLSASGFLEYDLRTMRLIIQDTPSRLDKMAKLLEQLDIATLQVYLEVDIVQVNKVDELNLGTEMAIGRESAGAEISTTTAAQFSLDPFASIGSSGITFTDISDGRYKLEIEAMVREDKAQVIASPRLLAADDTPAYFNLGSEEPYSVRQRGYSGGYGGYGGYSGGYGGDYYTQRSRPVGTILDIIPHISEAGYIDMEISVEDSSADRVDLGNDQQGLRVHQTLIETRVTVKDRRTVVLGGVINRKTNDGKSGVPFLRKVPILGAAFGKTTSSDEKTKLLIFITPTIVNIDDPYDFAFVENTERIRQLREGGALDFTEANVDKSLLDWSDEIPYEKEEVIFDKRPTPKEVSMEKEQTEAESEIEDSDSVIPANLKEQGYQVIEDTNTTAEGER